MYFNWDVLKDQGGLGTDGGVVLAMLSRQQLIIKFK
jgi:hypothetical protein